MSTVEEQFAPLFEPKTIAVVGASATSEALSNVFIRRLLDFGYTGTIYPIHPSAQEINGLKAYRSLAQTPLPIDFAYIAVSAAQIPDMLVAAAGRVRFAQVVSSGFGEVDSGKALQQRLIDAAAQGGMRLIGPNCLGTYTPRGKMCFAELAPREPGSVGIVSQSGGLGTDIIRKGMSHGLKFSGLVTVGNCADVNSSDLLEFYLADAATRVIGFYIETAQDGRRLFEILRAAQARKPVVILKGGRSSQGRAAAVSHTGALAGDVRAWGALSRQTGCVLVDTLEQFIDTLLVFQCLSPRPGKPTTRIALFGNGGGTSVLATDYYARLGLDVLPFDDATIAALEALKMPAGASVTNPVDCPAPVFAQDEGRLAGKILEEIYSRGKIDALVMHINMAVFAGRVKPQTLTNLIQTALAVKARHAGTHFVLVLRSDGEPDVEARKREFRAQVVALGIPVYDEMSNAGHALAALQWHERFITSRSTVAS
jgi:acyl-CoA synthetase (NDP forming)